MAVLQRNRPTWKEWVFGVQLEGSMWCVAHLCRSYPDLLELSFRSLASVLPVRPWIIILIPFHDGTSLIWREVSLPVSFDFLILHVTPMRTAVLWKFTKRPSSRLPKTEERLWPTPENAGPVNITVYIEGVTSQVPVFLGNILLSPGLAFCTNYPTLVNPVAQPWVLGFTHSPPKLPKLCCPLFLLLLSFLKKSKSWSLGQASYPENFSLQSLLFSCGVHFQIGRFRMF